MTSASGPAGASADQDGSLTATVAILPNPPVRGRAAEVILSVHNPRAEELVFRLDGDLAAAMFIGGTDGVGLASAEPGRLRTELAWPRLSLGANSTGRVRVDTVLRGGDAGAVIVAFDLQDLGSGESQRAELTAEPEWPERNPDVTWTGLIVALLIALGVGLGAGLPLARLLVRMSGGGVKARLGAAAVLALAVICVLALMLFAADDYRLLTSYRAATCEVTDRLVVHTSSRAVSTRESSSRTQMFRPMLAVRLSSEEGSLRAIWGDGDEPDLSSGSIGWAQERIAVFELGGTYDCWYDPDNPQFVAMEREVSPWPLLLIGLVLAALALPATLINRRARRTGS